MHWNENRVCIEGKVVLFHIIHHFTSYLTFTANSSVSHNSHLHKPVILSLHCISDSINSLTCWSNQIFNSWWSKRCHVNSTIEERQHCWCYPRCHLFTKILPEISEWLMIYAESDTFISHFDACFQGLFFPGFQFIGFLFLSMRMQKCEPRWGQLLRGLDRWPTGSRADARTPKVGRNETWQQFWGGVKKDLSSFQRTLLFAQVPGNHM